MHLASCTTSLFILILSKNAISSRLRTTSGSESECKSNTKINTCQIFLKKSFKNRIFLYYNSHIETSTKVFLHLKATIDNQWVIFVISPSIWGFAEVSKRLSKKIYFLAIYTITSSFLRGSASWSACYVRTAGIIILDYSSFIEHPGPMLFFLNQPCGTSSA